MALSRQRKMEGELGSGLDVLPIFDKTPAGAEIDEMNVSSALSVTGKSSFEHESRISSAGDRPLLVHNSPSCESGQDLRCIEYDRVCQMSMLQFFLCRY
jgi:hypothetical protein